VNLQAQANPLRQQACYQQDKLNMHETNPTELSALLSVAYANFSRIFSQNLDAKHFPQEIANAKPECGGRTITPMHQTPMRPKLIAIPGYLLAGFLVTAGVMNAETGYEAWLRYAPIDGAAVQHQYDALPAVVVALGDSPEIGATQEELIRGLHGTLGRTLRAESRLPNENAIVLGTAARLKEATGEASLNVRPDGYRLKSMSLGGHPCLVITAISGRGVLYGAFALLRRIALGENRAALDERAEPWAPVRWVNQWDNLDGTIERGYGGRSIFFHDGHVTSDLGRVDDFARLLAPIGLNGCTVNNVNANSLLLTTPYISELARIAGTIRP
jgi:alpha-glucuronidase